MTKVSDAVEVSPAVLLNMFKAKIQRNGLMRAPLASDVQGTIWVCWGRSAENKTHPVVTIKNSSLRAILLIKIDSWVTSQIPAQSNTTRQMPPG